MKRRAPADLSPGVLGRWCPGQRGALGDEPRRDPVVLAGAQLAGIRWRGADCQDALAVECTQTPVQPDVDLQPLTRVADAAPARQLQHPAAEVDRAIVSDFAAVLEGEDAVEVEL